MDGTTLFIGLITGLLGTAYFIYGKKQRKLVPIVVGICLSIVPFVFGGWLSCSAVSILLCLAPFVIKG
jgi:4-hydroxybenzoate polyprenyltransferase